MAEPASPLRDSSPPPQDRDSIGTGPGRLLYAVYLIFAVAAGARAIVQIATKFHVAPLAYLLSAVAAAVYIAAAWGLRMGGPRGRLIALTGCSIEMAGVLIVGTLTLIDDSLFPDQTVWSDYGSGYGWIPLILPMIGLYWLWRNRPRD